MRERVRERKRASKLSVFLLFEQGLCSRERERERQREGGNLREQQMTAERLSAAVEVAVLVWQEQCALSRTYVQYL